MYLYETHMHTSPVSRCARSTVREMLEFYKSLGYQGVFITNHFIDGNVNIDRSLPYEDKVRFYFSDYDEAVRLSAEIGIDVFLGVELSYGGTDFLVYGLSRDWFLSHPEIEEMKKSCELRLMMDEGAFIVQAHPFREANYIDHIRLFPRHVHAIEVKNAAQPAEVNEMARLYADAYGLPHFAGSDSHSVNGRRLAGLSCEERIESSEHFIRLFKAGGMKIFTKSLD